MRSQADRAGKEFDIAYLARGAVDSPANVVKTTQMIKKALKKQMNGEGFCLVEVLSPCPTNWNKAPADALKFMKEQQEQFFKLGEFVDKEAKYTFLPEGAEYIVSEYDPNSPITCEKNQKFVADIKDAEVIINSYVYFGKELIDAMDHCKCISFQSTGYNAADLEYAASKGVAVISILDYCTQETAENAIASMMALQRNTINYNRDIQEKRIWDWTAHPGMQRVEGQTISIIGFGRIGQHVGRIAGKGLGMRVLAYDPYLPPHIAEEQGAVLGYNTFHRFVPPYLLSIALTLSRIISSEGTFANSP